MRQKTQIKVLTIIFAVTLVLAPFKGVSAGYAAITEYPIPTDDAGAYNIATGPDGNVWFTETYANAVGTTDVETGETTEYPIPTENSNPGDIVSGP